MTKLSLAMIVKNEAETIERVLECAQSFADEIIVVDTGSTDNTVELAKAMGAKIYHFKWVDDFAAARNFAFSKTKYDWVMWLDADDVLTDVDQHKIKQLKETELKRKKLSGIFFTYQYGFNANGDCTCHFERERIVRKSAGCHWRSPIHEVVVIPKGEVLYRLDINVRHQPLPEKQASKKGRNLKVIYKAYKAGYQNEDKRLLYHYGRESMWAGNYKKAIQMLKAYFPFSTMGWEQYQILNFIGNSYRNLKQIDKAREYYFKAIALSPSRAEAYVDLGITYYDEQRWQEAIPLFTAATRTTAPTYGIVDLNYYNWLCYDYLGVCFERTGRYEEASQMMLKALENSPEPDRVLKNIQYIVKRA